MVKVFDQSKEKQINTFLKKYPGSKIVSYSPDIVIEYEDIENICTPYRVIKFEPKEMHIKLIDGDIIYERFTKIKFFHDCIMFGDFIVIYDYKITNDEEGFRASLVYKNSNKQEIKIVEIGGLSTFNWMSAYWEDGSFEKRVLSSIETVYPNYIECDEDYKYDTRTKALTSIGKNIEKGLNKVSYSIESSGEAIASSIAHQAQNTKKVAQAIAHGTYDRSIY